MLRTSPIKGAYILISLFVLLGSFSCKTEKTTTDINPFESLEITYTAHLDASITSLEGLSVENDFDTLKNLYLEARKSFKRSETILAFVDSENYKYINQPNIIKVDEDDFTDIKIKKPTGFQVLEEEIFVSQPNLETVHRHARSTAARLRLIRNNTDLGFLKDHHFLWMLRDGINRVALTGITGFDSPVLENSLEEAKIVYQSLQEYIGIFKGNFNDKHLLEEWKTTLESAMVSLQAGFNEFDRYDFIKNHTHKTLVLWNRTADDWQVDFPFAKAINNDASSLFSDKTFNLSYFSSESFDSLNTEKVKLGELLFHEKSLSLNNMISCASCHQVDKYYTDGKRIADGVARNSPTLLYAALQKGFFHDNRAGSLEGQIVSVVNNENEFHSDLGNLKRTVEKDSTYANSLKKLYKNGVTVDNIRNAIASFIRSLAPFNSKFDKNINGFENTLTASEINGFNVFNGKAKCATCHFPPIFNGTVPVAYKESEMELIGVPTKKDTVNAIIDTDLGRYYVYGTDERKHFFKTPTIRNSDLTAPYMHNGVYDTMEEVIDFYNRGGGAGIGIDSEYQTLPLDKLNLTKQEIKDLIAFIKTLNDGISSSY